MGYELTLALEGGWIEIEGGSQAEVERRLARLDLAKLERAIAKARAGRPPARKKARATKRRR